MEFFCGKGKPWWSVESESERILYMLTYVLVVQTRGGEKTPKFGRCVQLQCGGVDANSTRPPSLRWERGRNLTSQERKWRWERSAEGAHSFSPHPVLGFERSVRIIAPGAARKRGHTSLGWARCNWRKPTPWHWSDSWVLEPRFFLQPADEGCQALRAELPTEHCALRCSEACIKRGRSSPRGSFRRAPRQCGESVPSRGCASPYSATSAP